MLKELCRIALWSSYEELGGSMVQYNVFYHNSILVVDLHLLDINGEVVGGCVQIGSKLLFLD